MFDLSGFCVLRYLVMTLFVCHFSLFLLYFVYARQSYSVGLGPVSFCFQSVSLLFVGVLFCCPRFVFFRFFSPFLLCSSSCSVAFYRKSLCVFLGRGSCMS